MTDYSHIQISLIGFGHVGRSILHLLLQERQRQFSINIIDPSHIALGAEFDLGPAHLIEQRHDLFWNDTERLENADFIFYSAGVSVPKGECRDFKVGENRAIVNQVFNGIALKDTTTIITLTNPLDAIALDILIATNLPFENILGIGTLIESARMKYYLSKALKTGAKKIHTLVIGEHGETMVPVLSQTTVNGTPITQVLSKEQIQEIIFAIRTTPQRIKETQPASFYTAATASLRLFEILINPMNEVLPLSIYHENDEIFYTLPVCLSRSGLKTAMPKLSADELESLEWSKRKIRSMSETKANIISP